MTITRYHSPRSLAEVSELTGRLGATGAVLSGGTVLVPELSRAGALAREVIDLRALPEAHGIGSDAAGLVRIGAATSYGAVCRSCLASSVPVLAAAAQGITGGEQIRNQATVGGSAAYANPSSDVPACLVALEASMLLWGPGGGRSVAALEFFRGAFMTDRAPDEMLLAMTCPAAAPGTRTAYRKFKLAESSWPIITASATLAPGGDLRVVIGAAYTRPLALRCDPALVGRPVRTLAGEFAAAVSAAAAVADAAPWGDVLADGDYRASVAPIIAARAVGDLPGVTG